VSTLLLLLAAWALVALVFRSVLRALLPDAERRVGRRERDAGAPRS
jgi:hypothetical protein